MKTTLTLLCALCLSLVVSAQSPVDGAWTFTMNSPMGSVTAKVDLKAKGDTLTGNFDMGGGRIWPVKAGTIKGDQIAFTLDRDGSMTYEMRGVVKGATIAGVAAAMGTTVDWEMDRAK